MIKADVHNSALPAAEANLLGTALTPIYNYSTFNIQVAVSIAGILRVTITRSGNTQTVNLNVVAGPSLVADALYQFKMMATIGDTINFKYSTTGGTIKILKIVESSLFVG